MKSYRNHLATTRSYGESLPLDYRPTMRSSAVFPVHYAEGKIDTEVSFLGYWLMKRDIREVCALITLRDRSGMKVHLENVIIDSARSFNWRIGDMLGDKDRGAHFLGSIEIEIFSTRDMVFPYPAVTLSYVGEMGRSFVHTCGRIYNDFDDLHANAEVRVPETGFDLLPGPDIEPFFGFVNGPVEIRDEPFSLEFVNSEGDVLRRNRALDHVPPYGTAWVNIFADDMERSHLKGVPGAVKIRHDFRGFFPRFVVGNDYRQLGAVSLTHSYYDTSDDGSDDALWTNPDPSAYFDSVTSFPVPRDFDKTELVVYPIYRSNPARLVFEFFNSNGEFLFRDDEYRLLADAAQRPQYIDCSELARRREVTDEDLLCKVIVDGGGCCPTRLKFGLNFSRPSRIDLPSNICFGAKVANEKILGKPGTFKWCTLFDAEHERIYLTNTGFPRADGRRAKVSASVRRQSDDASLDWDLEVAWNGTLEVVAERRDDIAGFLNGEVGWIAFQANGPFVDGYYVTDHGGGLIGADHLY